ncbi:microtubule-associated proteins 70-5 [Actinidia rufa]|uniref:Microtubule-associated proteins 70-5 n=1 Tax=Actinidia rufa TaxID=165716 RepID=A0A7J0FYT6_9ERIC|nr:microtubule-associated proteins 70-5 [Actinidia rufa]
MLGIDELGGEELSLAHPDPVVLELNRLQNLLKEKDRELGGAQNEIKALKATEVLKDKAIEELTNEFNKLDGKLRFTENLLRTEEATLRRVHANQKEDDSVPIESVIAPLEADIKMYKNEIMALLEDKKALERLTKSKEVALLEAEKILRSALERALIVEEEEKRTLERELARVKVSANRVATVVANEWKGENDKVMPVKQWLDERRLLQAEMQRLRDKLVVSERTANAEAQLKDKLKLRLKTLEEGFKTVSIFSTKPSAFWDIKTKSEGTEESQNKGGNSDDKVSGFLYDRLQKEVIALRRFCEVKDSNLHAKDEEIKVLVKKVDTLTKAIEVEAKKLKREAVTKEKESVSAKMDDIKKIRNTTPSKSGNRVMKAS